ncbi:Vacuolar protein-sorting-associated protein 60 [Pestalotiopsis sp. IQ-011]
MNRLFGSGSKAPKPTLNSAISNIDGGIAKLDVQIARINTELRELTGKMNRMPPSGKAFAKKRARDLLTQRRKYEQQREQQQQQVWNMEQAQMMQDNLKGVMATVDAMKTTSKELKKQYGKVDIDKIERLQDEMADLMDVGNEIQESLSRAYDLPDDVDEDELDAELEMLGAEMEMEAQQGVGAGEVPDFLKDEVPDFVDEPVERGKVQEAAR